MYVDYFGESKPTFSFGEDLDQPIIPKTLDEARDQTNALGGYPFLERWENLVISPQNKENKNNGRLEEGISLQILGLEFKHLGPLGIYQGFWKWECKFLSCH